MGMGGGGRERGGGKHGPTRLWPLLASVAGGAMHGAMQRPCNAHAMLSALCVGLWHLPCCATRGASGAPLSSWAVERGFCPASALLLSPWGPPARAAVCLWLASRPSPLGAFLLHEDSRSSSDCPSDSAFVLWCDAASLPGPSRFRRNGKGQPQQAAGSRAQPPPPPSYYGTAPNAPARLSFSPGSPCRSLASWPLLPAAACGSPVPLRPAGPRQHCWTFE